MSRDEARAELERQLKYEREGAAAARMGMRRKDCPYDHERHPFEWNHWVYGNDNEWGPNA